MNTGDMNTENDNTTLYSTKNHIDDSDYDNEWKKRLDEDTYKWKQLLKETLEKKRGYL